jgi:ABC-type lipoprotein export system ATPase subunit
MRVIISGLSMSWGSQRVLHDVSADFSSPQRVSIMGPSGAGKSTLLAAIAGQIEVREGAVEIIAEAFEQPRPEWVVQSAPMLPRRTTAENVMIGPLSRGHSELRAQALARRAATELGLGTKLRTAAYRLSGGERQRVAVARALAAGAALVLADEPTASLDAASKLSVISALERVSDHGALLIVATHDPDVAEACDRRFRLVDGRLVEERS